MIECHTHCSHSVDSSTDIRDMIDRAMQLGVKYIAFTDHCDGDYLYNNSPDKHTKQINLNSHIAEVLQCQREYKDKIYVALGIELGYTAEAQCDYKKVIDSTDEWDIIVNSIHTVLGIDCYRAEFFSNLSKREAYNKYLIAVLDSVKASYSYDVIAHLGYVIRRAPFADNTMVYGEHKDIIDAILNEIIYKNVSLELNTHTKSTEIMFLPSIEIIKRYIELGGKQFTFGTDAHGVDTIGRKYKETASIMKEIGVKYFNVYKKRNIEKIKI